MPGAGRRAARTTALAGQVAAALVLAAALLWPTDVPGGLAPPPVDVEATFGAAVVQEAERHRRFGYASWALAQAAALGALVLAARRAPRLAPRVPGSPLVRALALGLGAAALAWLAQLPFRAAQHWWDRRHDLSTEGYPGALLGWAWEAGLGLLALAVALSALVALARRLGERWWLPGAGVVVCLAALALLLQPLVEGGSRALRDPGLLAAAERHRDELGLGAVALRVEEVSDDTPRANALALGLGPTRRVVLHDTALRPPFGPREQRMLLAHELAHHAERHLLEGLAWLALAAVPGAWLVMRATRRRGGLGEPAAVPLALLVAFVLQLAATPAANVVSRRLEAEADWRALELTRDPAAFERLLAGFAQTSLRDPDPPRAAQLLLGTHPSLAERAALARAWADRQAR